MKISVVTVCYNAVREIEGTMLSVLNQTYPDVEYIVIDGGSTDGTVDIIKKYAPRLAYWVSEPDKGIFDAMNKGITHSSGEYLNFMNAGDKFHSPHVISDFFEKRHSFPDFIAGIAILKKESKIPLIWEPVRKNFTLSEVINGGACNHQSCFIKETVIQSGYPLEYGIIADELLFLEKVAFDKSSYERLLKPVAVYDISGVSNDETSTNKIKQSRVDFLKKYLSDKDISALARKSSRPFYPHRILRKAHRCFLRLKLLFVL